MAPSEAAHYQSDNWDLHISRAYGNLVLEGFTKDGETLKHLVWQVTSADLVTALDLVLRYGRVVKRPYLLGQGCDGSIGAPVMALYLDFCTRHDLDAQTLYDLAYPGEKKLEPEATAAFATWQGVRLPYTWTEACFKGLLKSLSQLNEHMLESVLEDAVISVTFPRGVLERAGYVAFQGTTRCYGPDARFTWGYVVTPTGEKVWRYDPWQSKNGVVPQHYWLSFIAVAARHDGNLELARQVVAEAERSARSPANRAHYRNWLETDKGLLTHEELAKKKHTCPWCGEHLWQAEPVPRRFALGHYIAKRLPEFFDLFVIDEAHEMRSGGSAQGIAAGALAAAIPRTLGLTGTLFGGYASNLHFLLQRFSPAIREHYGYKEEGRFVEHFGVLERTTREADSGEDGRVSKRRKTTTVRERPGLSPALLPHLLWNTVFLRLTDVAAALPPYFEEIEILHMAEAQKNVHRAFKAELAAEVQAQLACGSKKLLGAYLQSLLHHPDTPWREEAVFTTDKNGVPYLVAAAEALDDSVVYPKEQRLLDIAKEEKRRGRRLMVFVQGTDRRDITRRLSELLEREGLKAAVLKSHTVQAKKREAWVQRQVDAGADVLICHPRIVQTGLDLIAFPTLVFYQTEYSVYTLRQASRRSWRIGQDRPVKVIHLAYEETLQTQALGLVAKKAQASLALEGELVEGGLVAMAEDDLMLSLAKSLVAGSEDSPIINLSSAYGEEDDFVTELPPVQQSVLDALDDLFGSLPREEATPVLVQDAGSQPVVRIAFTDAPVTLGKGGRRKKVSAGVGMLFPEMMVA